MKPITDTDMIQFVGIKKLDPMDQELINRISTENFEKIKRKLKNIVKLRVHIKTYEHEGKQKKYSIHLQAAAPAGILNVDKEAGFDLARTLNKAFENMRQVIEHTYHQEGEQGTERQ
ncbi:hypothetical protein GF358_02660 [Candidatus Woesearchaeota archaeon]|nr:hypothetical protein [Candidatus Woesearchaeota archaeon]